MDNDNRALLLRTADAVAEIILDEPPLDRLEAWSAFQARVQAILVSEEFHNPKSMKAESRGGRVVLLHTEVRR